MNFILKNMKKSNMEEIIKYWDTSFEDERLLCVVWNERGGCVRHNIGWFSSWKYMFEELYEMAYLGEYYPSGLFWLKEFYLRNPLETDLKVHIKKFIAKSPDVLFTYSTDPKVPDIYLDNVR